MAKGIISNSRRHFSPAGSRNSPINCQKMLLGPTHGGLSYQSRGGPSRRRSLALSCKHKSTWRRYDHPLPRWLSQLRHGLFLWQTKCFTGTALCISSRLKSPLQPHEPQISASKNPNLNPVTGSSHLTCVVRVGKGIEAKSDMRGQMPLHTC
jgi:hypothetical protein